MIVLVKRAEEPYHHTTIGMEWIHRWVGSRGGRRGWTRTGPVASPKFSRATLVPQIGVGGGSGLSTRTPTPSSKLNETLPQTQNPSPQQLSKDTGN